MTPREARQAIDAAFLVVGRLSHSTIETSTLFEKAHEDALASERQHRKRSGIYGGERQSFRNSVETAARYFVVKWFVDPATVADVRAAAALRLDCLYGSALRLAVDDFLKNSEKPSVFDSLDWETLERIRAVDYSDDIIGT